MRCNEEAETSWWDWSWCKVCHISHQITKLADAKHHHRDLFPYSFRPTVQFTASGLLTPPASLRVTSSVRLKISECPGLFMVLSIRPHLQNHIGLFFFSDTTFYSLTWCLTLFWQHFNGFSPFQILLRVVIPLLPIVQPFWISSSSVVFWCVPPSVICQPQESAARWFTRAPLSATGNEREQRQLKFNKRTN